MCLVVFNGVCFGCLQLYGIADGMHIASVYTKYPSFLSVLGNDCHRVALFTRPSSANLVRDFAFRPALRQKT
jgi:hypothetical protein